VLGNLGTGDGGGAEVGSEGWKSGEKFWLPAWEIVERGWEGGVGEEYSESEGGEEDGGLGPEGVVVDPWRAARGAGETRTHAKDDERYAW
jgi:hypothetical protein